MPPTSVAIATMVIGCTPSAGANGISASAITMPATLNIAGDSAGTKKWPSEFSIPISTAATATSVRNGNTMRVEVDGQLDLAGHLAEVRRVQPHERLGEDDPEQDDRAGDDQQRVDDRVGQPPRALAALERELPRERRNEGRAHGAFGEQVADEVGNPARDAERVVGVAGAEVVRHHLFANQPEDAARDGRQPEDPGGPGQAWRSAFALASFGGTIGIGHQLAKRSMSIPARLWNVVPQANRSRLRACKHALLSKKLGLWPFGRSPKEDGERLTRPFKVIDGWPGQNVCLWFVKVVKSRGTNVISPASPSQLR